MAREWTERHIIELIKRYGGNGGAKYSFFVGKSMNAYPMGPKEGDTDNGRPAGFGGPKHGLIKVTSNSPRTVTNFLDDKLIYLYGYSNVGLSGVKNADGIEYTVYNTKDDAEPPISSGMGYNDGISAIESWWSSIEKTEAGKVKLWAKSYMLTGIKSGGTGNELLKVSPVNAFELSANNLKVISDYSLEPENVTTILSDTIIKTPFWLEYNLGLG